MAGPFCCMLLGDMGADVIKVEPPGVGDQTRKSMGFRMKGEDSPGFLALNRNKRSITIDLKNEAGREVFYELVEDGGRRCREQPARRRKEARHRLPDALEASIRDWSMPRSRALARPARGRSDPAST